MAEIDFPIERRVGAWLLRVRVDDGGGEASLVVEGSWGEVERLTQRIFDTHPVSASAVWKLAPDEVLARLPEILEREPE